MTVPAGYRITTDAAEIDAVAAHAYLTTSYWADGIPLATVEQSIRHSLCIAVRHDSDGQVGFARLITDRATFAYLADVYVLAAHRGQGLADAMMAHLHALPELQGLRRWALVTRDAHPLYARHGWSVYPTPDRFMTRDNPDVYRPQGAV